MGYIYFRKVNQMIQRKKYRKKKKNPEWDITSQREIRRRKPEFLEQV